MQIAYLIEKELNGTQYFTFGEDGSFNLTRDANKALKFADQKSAELFGNAYALFGGMNAKVVEHGWPEGF